MPVFTTETLNPYRISRMIPMMLGATLGNLPHTVGFDSSMEFTLSAVPSTRRLDGRWLLLAWRINPDQPGITASVDVVSDGITSVSDSSIITNEYLVGPFKDRTQSPTYGIAIPQYVICEEYMELTGQVISGGSLLATDYVAMQLEYT